MSLLSAAHEVGKVPALKGKAAAGLRDFAVLMTELEKKKDAPPDEVIREVLDKSGYRRMLLDSTDPEDQERLANIEELITAAKQFAAEDAPAHHRRLFGEHHAGERRGLVEREAGRRVGDDDALGQGAGVPGGVPDGDGTGHLAARAERGPGGRGRGGAAAGVRGNDAGQGRAVPVPCPDARVPRPDAVRGAEHVSGRAAEGGRARRSTYRPGRAARRRRWSSGAAAEATRRRRDGPTPACVRSRPSHPPPPPAGGPGGRDGQAASTPRGCWCATGPTARAASRGERSRGATKVRIRFASAGERTFIADKVTLEILRKG